MLAVALLLLASCQSVLCPNDQMLSRPAEAGTYTLGVAQAECNSDPVPPLASDPEQHRLTVSSDRKQVQETFVRGGKTYLVEYDVVEVRPALLGIGYPPSSS